MSQAADREALSLLRRRDPRGFDELYRRYAARIHAFLRRLSGQRDVADDLLQHTFLRLAESGPNLRADSDVRAWLYTVARNGYLSLRRAAPAAQEREPVESLASPPPDIEARLLLGDVELALSNLRSEDREVLLLVAIEGLEQEVVARMLELEAPALRQRLSRARARLLAELAAPVHRTSSGAALDERRRRRP